ncbi:MAG: lysylphosphatidylglycerol synthase transmembrane domain-containing protein [Thermovirgaceae bacterium]
MSVRKGLALFIGLTTGVSAAILLSSVDLYTWKLILEADKSRLFGVCGLVLLFWNLDALKLYFLVHAAEERIRYRFAFLLNWLRYFGCAITPMQSGGGPFQVYFMFKAGIPIGKGVAITLVSTLMTLFQVGLIVPLVFLFKPEMLEGRFFLHGVLGYVVLFVVGTWLLVVLSLVRPSLMKKWAGMLLMLLKRVGVVKPKRVLRTLRRIHSEIDNYSRNFRLFFSKGFPLFLIALVFSWMQMVAMFSILPCLIWSLDLEVNFGEAFLAQALFLFILYFVPTPGASGVAEGGGAAIFSFLVPWNMAGVLVIAWRFFTEYISIAMGALVAVRLIGWGETEALLQTGDCKDENQ